MKFIYILFIIMLVPGFNALSFSRQEEDSTFINKGQDSTYMEADSILRQLDLKPGGEIFKPDYNETDSSGGLQIVSWGWFPKTYNYWNLSFSMCGGSLYDVADNISTRGLARSPFLYSGRESLDGDERKIKKSFSDEDEDDDYPETYYGLLGLEYSNSFSTPLIFRSKLNFIFQDGLLFSNTINKNYLNTEGQKETFKEASLCYLEETHLYAGLGFEIPFYGVFSEFGVNTYYYLYSGVSAGYVLSSSATQYIQIANNKDRIRYKDGRDTLTLLNGVWLPGINRSRYYLNLGLGMDLSARNIGDRFELFWDVPLNPVVNDASWKQHVIGIKIALHFGGFFYL